MNFGKSGDPEKKQRQELGVEINVQDGIKCILEDLFDKWVMWSHRKEEAKAHLIIAYKLSPSLQEFRGRVMDQKSYSKNQFCTAYEYKQCRSMFYWQS